MPSSQWIVVDMTNLLSPFLCPSLVLRYTLLFTQHYLHAFPPNATFFPVFDVSMYDSARLVTSGGRYCDQLRFSVS